MPTKPATRHNLSYQDAVSHQLSDARRINLFGEIGQYAMANMVNSLDYMLLQDKKKAIEVRLNSPGGSVIDGLAIYDVIVEAAKKTPINMTVNGAAMSMGVIILQAATKRRAYRHSEFLLHEISYGVRGKRTEHEDFDKMADRMQTKLDEIIVGRSHITLDELKTLARRRDYTIDAEEALQHGLIDEIIR